MFERKLNNNETLAGVFDFEDNVGYFYLYDISNEEDKKILDHIFISNNLSDFANKDIDIKWSHNQENVVLFAENNPLAMFNVKSGEKFNEDELNSDIIDSEDLL